jgi:hypothetical protein
MLELPVMIVQRAPTRFLLRSLFGSARATGLCLYDRNRMPLAVIDGALSTHPVIRAGDAYSPNAFYDVTVQSLREADPVAVISKLEQAGAPSSRY